MAMQKKVITIYERDKDKVKISGEQVKWLILIDQISNVLRWLIPIIILLVVLPKASLIPILLKWLKQQIFFILLFVAVADWPQIFLSG